MCEWSALCGKLSYFLTHLSFSPCLAPRQKSKPIQCYYYACGSGDKRQLTAVWLNDWLTDHCPWWSLKTAAREQLVSMLLCMWLVLGKSNQKARPRTCMHVWADDGRLWWGYWWPLKLLGTDQSIDQSTNQPASISTERHSLRVRRLYPSIIIYLHRPRCSAGQSIYHYYHCFVFIGRDGYTPVSECICLSAVSINSIPSVSSLTVSNFLVLLAAFPSVTSSSSSRLFPLHPCSIEWDGCPVLPSTPMYVLNDTETTQQN